MKEKMEVIDLEKVTTKPIFEISNCITVNGLNLPGILMHKDEVLQMNDAILEKDGNTLIASYPRTGTLLMM